MDFRDVKGNKINVSKDLEYGWRPAVYGVLIEDNSLLVIKPSWDDKYSLPGGSMELGETPAEALKREFMEETGHKVEIRGANRPYVDSFLFGSEKLGKYFQRLSLYYEVVLTSKEAKVSLDDETIELCWKKVEDLNARDFTFFQKDFLKSVIKK